MDKKTEATMAANLLKNTGKSIDEWAEIAKKNHKSKHSDAVNWLKDNFGLGLFFADLIVHKANGTDANSFSEDELILNQYQGKEQLKIVYDKIIEQVLTFGTDVEIAPKKAYVSLRSKKQFACLKPATKSRFEIELILKGYPAQGILEKIDSVGAMCTHKIKLEHNYSITEEIINWLKLSYQKSK
jgi:predicted transport protein